MWSSWTEQEVVEDEYKSSAKGLIDKYQGMIENYQSGHAKSEWTLQRGGVCTGKASHSAPDACWGTEKPHTEESLVAAVVHNAESQVRATNGPQQETEALQYPAPVQVHPANLVEEEEVPMPFHYGEEHDPRV